MDYTVSKTEKGYRIVYKGYPMGGYYDTRKEAEDQISMWIGKPWEQKYTAPVKADSRVYGVSSDAYRNDNNEQGEP